MNAFFELEADLSYDNHGFDDIETAYIKIDNIELLLKKRYTKKELEEFTDKLKDIEYDANHSESKLFGLVLLKNGNWLERVYAHSEEWWEYQEKPDIHEFIKETKKGRIYEKI
jgi:hypothetical protein